MSKYTIKEWKAVKAELAAGYTIRKTAQRTGVERGTVLRWSHREKPSGAQWDEEMTQLLDFDRFSF